MKDDIKRQLKMQLVNALKANPKEKKEITETYQINNFYGKTYFYQMQADKRG